LLYRICSAYIHFENWYNTDAAQCFQERVLNPDKEARLVYDDPWHWIVLENKARKYSAGERKPRINLDTPVINRVSTVPPAPQKSATELAIIAAARALGWHWPYQPRNLEDEFEYEFDEEAQLWLDEQIDSTIEGQMDIVEDSMAQDDNRLATFERGYVQMLEEENAALRRMISQVQN
jgi:hypothetical protein